MKVRDKLAVFAASELLVLQWRHEGLIPPGVDILRNGTALGKPILGMVLKDNQEYLLAAYAAGLDLRKTLAVTIRTQDSTLAETAPLIPAPLVKLSLAEFPLPTRMRVWYGLLTKAPEMFPKLDHPALVLIGAQLAIPALTAVRLARNQVYVRLPWPSTDESRGKQLHMTVAQFTEIGTSATVSCPALIDEGCVHALLTLAATPSNKRAFFTLKSEHSTLPFKLGKTLATSTLAKHMARIRADSSLEPALLEAFVSKASAAVKPTINTTNKRLPSPLSGQVDGLRDRTLRGWALNRAKPFETVYVDIYVEGELLQTVPANLFRPGLKTEGLTGNFGFEIELAANHLNGAKHQVSACFAESSVQLVGSPLLLGHGYFDAEIALTDDTTLSGWIKERCLHPAFATVEITVDSASIETVRAEPSAKSSGDPQDELRFTYSLPSCLFTGETHSISVSIVRDGRSIPLVNTPFQVSAKYLQRHAVEEQSLAKLLRFSVDYLVPVDGVGVFLHGYLIDPQLQVQSLLLVVDQSNVIPLHRLARTPRPDIYEAFESESELDTVDLGFLCLVPNAAVSSSTQAHSYELYVVTKSKQYVRYPIGPDTIDRLGTHPTLSQIKTLLSIIHPSTSIHPFLEHIGPVIRGLWASRNRPEITPIVQSFGGSTEEPKVSVIVPLYGRYDFLRYQLALFANDPDFRTIDLLYVVDDPRIQRDVLKLATELHPLFRVPFRVLTTGHNLGYAGANNAGANVALGRYLVLLNSDVMPRSPGWVSRLTDIYESLSNPGALGVKLLYEDQSIQHAGMAFDKNAELGNLWTNQHPFKGQPDWRDHDGIPRPVHAVTAACMFLSRSSFLELGGLDEAYILGDFEDSDLCLRLLASGRQNYYAPSVELYHLERQSQSLVSTQAWKHNLTLYNCWLHHERWSSTIEALQAEKFVALTAPAKKPTHTSTVLPIRDKQEKTHQRQAKVRTSATSAAQSKRSHRPTRYA